MNKNFRNKLWFLFCWNSSENGNVCSLWNYSQSQENLLQTLTSAVDIFFIIIGIW